MSATATEPFQARIERDVVEAAGPDAAGFLQGQLSQDVAGLAVGASAYSLLLQPQGKVDAWLRVTRLDPERFVLDVDAGYGDAVIARLNRFKLRTKCELTRLEGWVCWAVRGIAGDAVAAGAPEPGDTAAVRAVVGWPATVGFDRLGPADRLDPLPGIPVGDTDRYVRARIEAGVAAMGSELGPETIPAEAGQWLIDASVSFTKGCYTGQELVARVDSRGSNTPRRLRLLRAAEQDAAALVTGAALVLDGAEVGTVTSAAAGSPVALDYLTRAVEPPATVRCNGVNVEVEALPVG
ncbi:MAG: folate-binding protein YgfZ [Acidimicrobiales bacterium]|nr:folate-binding protein YgfZ [Acidimicrobiales bacterium]